MKSLTGATIRATRTRTRTAVPSDQRHENDSAYDDSNDETLHDMSSRSPKAATTSGDHLVKLSGGRIVEVEVKAILDTMDGMRLQVSFREETVDAFQRFSR